MRSAKHSIVLAKGLRLFRPTYRDRDGNTRQGERWAVEFQWAGKARRVTAGDATVEAGVGFAVG